MTKPLTHDEHAEVTAYALKHGENWKDQLASDWMNGRTTGTLQRLRNTHGPAWLQAYSLADWPKSLFSPAARLEQEPRADLAAEACRLLITAYAKNPEHVDWSDVQTALDMALKAFDLPSDYPQIAFEADQ